MRGGRQPHAAPPNRIEVMRDHVAVHITSSFGLFTALVDLEDKILVGNYRWRIYRKNQSAGKHSEFYVGSKRPRTGEQFMLHREILGLGPHDGKVVSHRNHNPLDNRRANLAVTSHRGNLAAGHMGQPARGTVYIEKRRRWRATIRVNGKATQLGHFLTEEEAHAAWKREHDRLLAEEHERLGLPPPSADLPPLPPPASSKPAKTPRPPGPRARWQKRPDWTDPDHDPWAG